MNGSRLKQKNDRINENYRIFRSAGGHDDFHGSRFLKVLGMDQRFFIDGQVEAVMDEFMVAFPKGQVNQ